MDEYDNSNSGALFENDKRTTDKHPHLRGSATIKTPDGELVEYWVSAWQKTSKKGNEFFSLSFEQKKNQEEKIEKPKAASQSSLFKSRNTPQPASKNSVQDDLDDSVPF